LLIEKPKIDFNVLMLHTFLVVLLNGFQVQSLVMQARVWQIYEQIPLPFS